MGDNFYMLLWGGLFFLAIGLWMRKKDRNQIQLMDEKIAEKENNLYELYQSLEEIMNEMNFLYRDKIELETPKADTEKDETNLIPQEEQGQQDLCQDKPIEEQDTKTEDKNQVKANQQQIGKPVANKYHRVIELKEQGYTEEEIARKLNIGKGEVRLILGFNK